MKPERHIIHVDMDAFYASVEQLDHPELKGQPIIVGGDPRKRGVVSAASYEARQYGIHSAMPMSQAVRLCPQAVIMPVRMNRYIDLSQQIRDIFYEYTPVIEPISIDEAFLDVTGSIRLHGSAEQIGLNIKANIRSRLGLVASVGIASNKFLAKLASDLDKPDGFMVVRPNQISTVLTPLHVTRIWGIGQVTSQLLKSHGINTIGQLKTTPLIHLKQLIGSSASELVELANGIDERPVITESQAKSLSSETTFSTDIDDADILLSTLHEQIEEVSQRLRRKQLSAKTITIKFRYGDFKTLTRSQSFDLPTHTTDEIWQRAKYIFYRWRQQAVGSLRLIGFGASSLVSSNAIQGTLFIDPEQEKQKKIDHALDTIHQRYGNQSLKRTHPSQLKPS